MKPDQRAQRFALLDRPHELGVVGTSHFSALTATTILVRLRDLQCSENAIVFVSQLSHRCFTSDRCWRRNTGRRHRSGAVRNMFRSRQASSSLVCKCENVSIPENQSRITYEPLPAISSSARLRCGSVL